MNEVESKGPATCVDTQSAAEPDRAGCKVGVPKTDFMDMKIDEINCPMDKAELRMKRSFAAECNGSWAIGIGAGV